MAIAFFNGEFVPVAQRVIPIEDRGHQFGDGVYEVIRIYEGSPFMLKEHLQRLKRSATAIKLHLNYSLSELEHFIWEGIKKSNLMEAEVYIQVTRGISPRQHLFPDVPSSTSMTIRAARNIPDSARREGVPVTLMDDERWANCYIKSLNLLPNILAKQAAVSKGFYESVFCKDGFITEGSSSNVFMVHHGKLYTPRATKQILHGITRSVVLDIAKNLHISVMEEEITVDFFKESEEVFITSTTMEVLPVHSIDGHKVYTGELGPITLQIQKSYESLYRSIIQR